MPVNGAAPRSAKELQGGNIKLSYPTHIDNQVFRLIERIKQRSPQLAAKFDGCAPFHLQEPRRGSCFDLPM
jgi:hypothetical protein